jgi:hypothetical protein
MVKAEEGEEVDNFFFFFRPDDNKKTKTTQ